VSSASTQSTYKIRAKLWRWTGGKANWHFVTLPPAISREIRLVDAGPRRTGFGALKVEAAIGSSTWKTSIFPSSSLKAYILPVKAAVRKAETLVEGKLVSVHLVVRRAG
jgi:hypothetical protein